MNKAFRVPRIRAVSSSTSHLHLGNLMSIDIGLVGTREGTVLEDKANKPKYLANDCDSLPNGTQGAERPHSMPGVLEA